MGEVPRSTRRVVAKGAKSLHRIARAWDAGPGSLTKEEKRNTLRTNSIIPLYKLLDGLPMLILLLSDSLLSIY